LVRGYKTNNNKEKSTQSVSKTIELTDTGETRLQRCSYTIWSQGVATSQWMRHNIMLQYPSGNRHAALA